jgi:luciferase family oxidoreductase group 1
MLLSVLDQSPIRKGGTPADAIAETIALAKACERLGYHRYWLAEHHNSNSFAGSAPEILIGRVASETKSIRVGSGGVMLTHYSPLKVAEQFRMLEVLNPGRIDLGLGRAPGTDQMTARALQAGPQGWDIDAFPSQVHLLRQFLDDASGRAPIPADHPYRNIHAMPRGDISTGPELWMLGSGIHGAVYAAELGMPFSHAYFISPENSHDAVAAYRERFKASIACPRPRLSMGVAALAAESEDEARDLAQSLGREAAHRATHSVPLAGRSEGLSVQRSGTGFVAHSAAPLDRGNAGTGADGFAATRRNARCGRTRRGDDHLRLCVAAEIL